MITKSQLFKVFTAILTAVIALTSFNACKEDSLETKGFVLYYTGMTDIGPSMSGIISSPTYKGGVPSGFAITSVSLEGSSYSGNAFTIDPNTGAISIVSTKDMVIGKYLISVSCLSDGKTCEFKDAVEVTFLKAVPESITVNPSTLEVQYSDVTGLTTGDLPTAQVETGTGHITVTNYQIANVKKDGTAITSKKMFSISKSGQISINRGANGFLPGVYVLDLKLSTAAVDNESEEGLFVNAISINVISKPLSLTYSPNPAKIEEESSAKTKYSSSAPTMIGSAEDLKYSIASVTPASNKIAIDSSTGIISVAEGHGFKNGETYAISVKVTNKYATDGVIFEKALTLNVTSYITPISGFSYTDINDIQGVAFSITPNSGLIGDDPTFEFTSISEADKTEVTLNPSTGVISATKGHALTLGEHNFTVRAKNDKNEMSASVKVTVTTNPNNFTFFSYGNNLGLTETQTSGVSQYRLGAATDLTALTLKVSSSDLPKNVTVTWEVTAKNQMSGTTIDEDGTLHFAETGFKASQTGVIFVKATAGTGDEAISVTEPVFFNFSVANAGVTLDYSPFVLRVNPRTGGRSVVPELKGTALASFYLDYRRTFNYYNLDGKKTDGTAFPDGQPTLTNGLLYDLWSVYFDGIGKTLNTGSKDPISYYSNQANLSAALLYVDNSENANKLSVVVNPNKWYSNGWADGVFIGQTTYVTNGDASGINKGTQIFPIAIWFDKEFNN